MQTSYTAAPRNGFSLLEILVVIGLMALMTGVFLPAFSDAFRTKGESVARKLSLTLGQARDRAMLTDKLIRLKVDFEKQTLSLEEAPSGYLVPKEPDHTPSEREKEEAEKKTKDTFRPSTDLMDKPLELPDGLKVIQVKNPRYKKPITEGITYVYFFNNGSTDGATIYFETDQKVHQAIFLHPITGLSRIEGVGPDDKR
jgi:prepilin-type N-terminal cleavage/methylation domain-containing protein